ncbi:alpha-1,4-glucan--maltose-1-phosphate maltosyltransferase [Lichenicoccus sp.]|uniref:alpha-1,4-glucan--maltose-1-phosphate maltosyltransferase n=1 Tax=Lichenicoccus sp. TaxID=2781899 RepID=UPI003D0FECA0
MDLIETGPASVRATAVVKAGFAAAARIARLPAAAARDPQAWSGFDRVLVPDVLHNAGEAGILASAQAALESVTWLVAATGPEIALLDLVVDCIAAAGDAAHSNPELFAAPDRAQALDPRQVPTPGLARPILTDPGAAARLGAFWGGLVASWVGVGLAGVRLRGLAGLPQAALSPLLAALRAQAPTAILIADTGGVAWEGIATLADARLDGVQCSLAWWNWQDGWFEDELAMLRPIAPVMAALDDQSAALGRALAFCAARGFGWIAPPGPAARAACGLAGRLAGRLPSRRLSAPGAAVEAYLCCDRTDPRWSSQADVLLFNARLDRASAVDPSPLLAATGGSFDAFTERNAGHASLVPGEPVSLAPGTWRLFGAGAIAAPAVTRIDPRSARDAATWPRLAIEAPSPAVDGGRFAVKRIAGESVAVEADVIGDGHDLLGVALQWHSPGHAPGQAPGQAWQERRMRLLGNDRWTASFPLLTRGLHRYRIEAWRDRYATFRHELGAKSAAGVPIALELTEGRALLRDAVARNRGIATILETIETASAEAQCALLLSDEVAALMESADDRPHRIVSDPIRVDAERTAAGFASWYEVFPRSMSDDPQRHGTFRDVERHLPRIRDMGFDVLYFPPIHPIGRTNRKGPNNTLTPAADDPGSPYAVGSVEGGHDAIHPQLGTLADFLHLRGQAEAHGLEVALDFAIQCAPDHPWLAEHKDWFAWRPDGTVRYAENPPKKYQDIVNVDFYANGAVPDLWVALANVVMYWAEQGIRLFRVDNPHTKPFPFWEWMIAEVRARYPDAVFLAEAFTRPKVMNRLGKVGFGQSYTYFTWRNSKAELTEYLTQLTEEEPRDFFRPHFFVNTPDINPVFLQTSGRGGYLIRAALAATLSGLWGVYNGFELCEGTPLPGREEYADSEKYQTRTWDWNRPGNIVAELTQLNRIRAENPALHSHLAVGFLPAGNDAVLFYEKTTSGRDNCIFCMVSLDPHNVQSSGIELPLYRWGLPDQASLQMQDLVGGGRFTLSGKYHSVTLTPRQPYLIWRASPLS